MKGPKIENIRDPKWVGKKIIVEELNTSPDKLVFVGDGQICTEDDFKSLSLWRIDCYDWYEWIEFPKEKKPEFPFKIGDRIRRKNWSHDDFIIVQSISEYYIYGCNGNGTSGHMFDYPKVIDIPNSEWELYIPPKKKKTYSMALLKFKEYETSRPFEFLGPFSSKEDVPTDSYEIIQFPAVTKDGTVLEFEVDDDS